MTKIDKSVLTFGITIFLKFMLFDILWCIPTTFASLSTVECYTTKLIATLILLIPYAFFRMWKTETLIMFLLDFLLIANLMYSEQLRIIRKLSRFHRKRFRLSSLV